MGMWVEVSLMKTKFLSEWEKRHSRNRSYIVVHLSQGQFPYLAIEKTAPKPSKMTMERPSPTFPLCR